ncbi:dihydroorotate dehydrogenase-like protein [Tessaracoccus flavus]|uniref:Dihydroorotate dehydrogenase n=1 Tax=Tessaracoccus flavus TaxID=1610493 RepID=A0A1Q2CGM9_9ACTN|nr:dihydroorotate dehydrogenase-like protein [Tessaracoccus flavus]AQP45271.1 dihydroorotate dehydrogenase [Tessaracoccus flavus]SDY50602.1 dihydroorotate dehydrogenase (fumarate) [Tessaracoccus flavus]
MTDLTTTYLGLPLRNPVVASAGPLSQTVEGIKTLADGGVGAVVMYSLFEEQLRREAAATAELEELYEDSYAEALSYFPSVPRSDRDASHAYLKLVEESVKSIDVPLIASLNGASMGGWTQTARQLADAGAAAIELNIYFVPGDIHMPGLTVEERHLEILAGVKQSVDVPVAVKLSPYFSSIGNVAVQLDAAGADGLVLFNRFLQPDIDIDRITVESGVSLSNPLEARLPRTWIAVLRGKIAASLAATTGVDTAEDVIKYILAGADVVMTTSALLRRGPAYAKVLVDGLEEWLSARQLTLAKARGLLAVPADSAEAYERAGYVSALEKAKTTYGSLR